MRRIVQGLRSVCRIHQNHKCGITCSAVSSSKAPSRQDQQPGVDLHLDLKTTNQHVFLEMPRLDSTTEFLTEIIKRSKAKPIWSQLFSESTVAQWLSKYGNNKGPQPEQTVSVEEFDPLKHMNTEQPDTLVGAKELGEDNCAAMSTLDVLPLPNHTFNISQSRESLNTIVNILDGSGDSMDDIEKQLGISSGMELPVGAKPVSSREKFLRKCLAQREKEFTTVNNLKLFCGTWNVNSKDPPDNLNSWLLVDDEPPDIYAIGFQELDVSKEAFIFKDSPRETEWLDKMNKCINTKVPYTKVQSIRLVGLLLAVFIQTKHMKYINYVDTDTMPTGIMGLMGDKGGVSVRLTLHKTSLCFVNSHLAAHQDEIERRNSDYKEIFNKMRFKKFDPPLEIQQHDAVFWVGDLNYRIDLPIDNVKWCIIKGMYDQLLQNDQLYKQMKINSEAFRGFKEGVPAFDPTYKFDPGTDNYDTSEKSRIPAWCDRILWRGSGVQQLRFSSHPELKLSDHKPVSSLFQLGMRDIDQKRYKCVYEEVMKKLDRLENEYLPHTKLDKAECVFKDVKFIEVQSQTVTVDNVGQEIKEQQKVTKDSSTATQSQFAEWVV